MTGTPKIFLSYTRDDQETVEKLYHFLSNAGFRPWMDTRDILAGEVWRNAIQRAIRDSDFFVVCLSENFVRRRGYLQKEVKDALKIQEEKLGDDIYVIPVRLDDCEIPDDLRDIHCLDLYEETNWQRLVRAIVTGMARDSGSSALPSRTPASIREPAPRVEAAERIPPPPPQRPAERQNPETEKKRSPIKFRKIKKGGS